MKTAEEYLKEKYPNTYDTLRNNERIYNLQLFEIMESFAKERSINFHSKANDEPEILKDRDVNTFYSNLYDDIYLDESCSN